MRRPAFTLVELLVAMAIIAILAALLLGVAARAGETAREARTKQLVARLHTLLMERYASYGVRRVEMRAEAENNFLLDSGPSDNTSDLTGVNELNVLMLNSHRGLRDAAVRLAAVREAMKMEMPDRWTDLMMTGDAIPIPVSGSGLGATIRRVDPSMLPEPAFLEDHPSLTRLYVRRYNEIAASGEVTLGQLLENQGAECLYMVVMNATADGEGRSLFNEDDVGDTDGDGAPEFLDGWGNPIHWLRWAPGFDSDAQLSYTGLARVSNRDPSGSLPFGAAGVEAEITADHDPLDLFRVDRSGDLPTSTPATAQQLAPARGWRLLPLIYSAGPDEETGLRDDAVDPANPYVARADPYADVDTITAENQWLGEPADGNLAPDAGEEYAGLTDNIHNHLITAR